MAISGESLTRTQLATAFAGALGKEVRYNSVSPDAYRGFAFLGAHELGEVFQFKRDFEEYYCGARSPDLARSLNPSLQTFKASLTQNKNTIPLE